MTSLEEIVVIASKVSLGLLSQSHISSESITEGQEQGVHNKIMDIINFHWLWFQKDFVF